MIVIVSMAAFGDHVPATCNEALGTFLVRGLGTRKGRGVFHRGMCQRLSRKP